MTKSNAISLFLGVIREEQVMRQSVHSRVEKTSDDEDHGVILSKTTPNALEAFMYTHTQKCAN